MCEKYAVFKTFSQKKSILKGPQKQNKDFVKEAYLNATHQKKSQNKRLNILNLD